MKLSDSAKFWVIFSSILIAAFFGGILGNWVFIYLLDKYYGVSGGNYMEAPVSSSVVVRDTKRAVIEQDNRITQTINMADRGIVKIFKKGSSAYKGSDAITSAAVITSDGWIVTPDQLISEKNSDYNQFEVIMSDRKSFDIEKVVNDPITGLNFIHLSKAQNLTVNDFASFGELSVGQTIVALDFSSNIEVGRLSRSSDRVLASEGQIIQLVLSDISNNKSYLYNISGQLVGIATGKNFVAIDSVEAVLENLLTDGKISHPRLGVYYLDLARAYSPERQSGALIMQPEANIPAIVAGSPADKAGLKAGDIIIGFDGTTVNEFNSLATLLGEYKAGDSIVLSVLRNKETKTINVTLDELIVK